MTLDKRHNIFLKTYPVTSLKNQIITGFIIGLTISFILIIFQPFGTYKFKMNYKQLFLFGYGMVFSMVYSIYYLFIMTVLRKWFTPHKWNIAKEVITVIPVLIIISIAALYYYNILVDDYGIRLVDFGHFFLICLAVGILPLSASYYHKYSKSKLISVNSSKSTKGVSIISIESNNKKEKPIVVESKHLVYIKSSGNYVEIWTTNRTNPYIVRNSLNYIEAKLPKHEFLKVHRSYIINIKALDTLNLRGSNYTVKINGSDLSIPVSRSVVKKVKTFID